MTEYHDALDRYLDDLADGKAVIIASSTLGLSRRSTNLRRSVETRRHIPISSINWRRGS